MAARTGGSALDRYWAELTSDYDDDDDGAVHPQTLDEEKLRAAEHDEQHQQQYEEQKKKKKKPFRYLDLPVVFSSSSDDDADSKALAPETDETADWFSGLRQRQARQEQEREKMKANMSDELAQAEHSVGEEKNEAPEERRCDESESDSDSDSGEERAAAGEPGAREEKRKRRKEERRKRKRQLLLRRLAPFGDATEGEEEKRTTSPEELEGGEGGVRPSKNKRRKLKKKRRMQELKRQPPPTAAEASCFIYVPKSGIEVRAAAKQEETLRLQADDANGDDEDGEGLVDVGICGVERTETTRSAYHAFVERMHAQRGAGTKEDEVSQFFEGVVGLMTRHVRKGSHSHSGEDVVKLVHDTEVGCSRLFQLLRSRQLPRLVVMSLWEIKSHLMKGQYCDANEKYFSLTIGSAPWPTTEPTLRAETMELLQTVKRYLISRLSRRLRLIGESSKEGVVDSAQELSSASG